jgi:hypothetical protein
MDRPVTNWPCLLPPPPASNIPLTIRRHKQGRRSIPRPILRAVSMVRGCVRSCVEELWLFFVPCEQTAPMCVMRRNQRNDSILGIAGKLLMRRDNTLHLIKGIVYEITCGDTLSLLCEHISSALHAKSNQKTMKVNILAVSPFHEIISPFHDMIPRFCARYDPVFQHELL